MRLKNKQKKRARNPNYHGGKIFCEFFPGLILSKSPNVLPAAIPRWKRRISSELRSEALQGRLVLG